HSRQKYSNIPVKYSSYFFSMGFQNIYYGWLTLDFSGAGILAFTKAENRNNELIASGIAPYNGPNLGGMGKRSSELYAYSSHVFYKAALGLSFTVKIGVLLI